MQDDSPRQSLRDLPHIGKNQGCPRVPRKTPAPVFPTLAQRFATVHRKALWTSEATRILARE